MVNKWKTQGLTEVPLTPYARMELANNFPNLDLTKINLSNPGLIQKALLNILTLGGASAMTLGNTVYNLSFDNSLHPGGFNQIGSTIDKPGELGFLSHEITHTVQQQSLAVFPRYLMEQVAFTVPNRILNLTGNILNLGIGGINAVTGLMGIPNIPLIPEISNPNYGVKPFNRINGVYPPATGNETLMFSNGHYVTLDNSADLNWESMEDRFKFMMNRYNHIPVQ